MRPINIVRRILDHPDYEEQYPEIKQFNVFSASALAWSWESQVQRKMVKTSTEDNGRMMVGRILGKVIAEEFQREDPGWIGGPGGEEALRVTLPYKWKNFPKLNGIIVIGHVDLIHHGIKEIIELKTSVFDNEIKEFAKIQASFYWMAEKRMNRGDYVTKVIKVAVPPKEHVLTPDEKLAYSKEIVKRAYRVAQSLDVK